MTDFDKQAKREWAEKRFKKTDTALKEFWKAWTDGKKKTPYRGEDVINDFIKPYTEFRRKMVFELGKEQLITTNNQLVAMGQLISRLISEHREAIDKLQSESPD